MRRCLLAVVVVTVALLSSGCVQFLTPGGPAPLRYRDTIFTTVTKTSDVVYGSAVDSTGTTIDLKLDVYEPVGDTVTKRPAIIWVHGGSFCCGDKTSPELVDESNVFGGKGFVNFSINYRLDPVGCSAAAGVTPSCVQELKNAMRDSQAAVRYVRKNASMYGVDPNRIAIGGSSAGAINALDVNYGANDIDPTGPNPGVSSAVRAAVSLSGAALATSVGPGAPPALDFHGTADTAVPYQWGVNTINNAKAAGDAAFLTTWEGAGHTPYVQFRQQILDQTTNFLYWAMDLAHAAR